MPHQCTNCGHVFEDGSKEMLSGCPECSGKKFQYHPGEVPDEQPSDAEPPERDSGTVTDAVGRAANKVRDAVSSEDEPGVGADSSPETTGTPVETEGDATTADADTAAAGDSPTPSAESPAAGETSAPSAESPAAEETPAASADTASTEEEPADDGFDSLDPNTDTTGVDQDARDAEVTAGDSTSAEDSAQASARSDVVDKNSLPDAPDDGRVVKEPDQEEDRPDLDDLREELNDQFESIRIVAPGQYELNLMELYDRQEYIIALQENGKYVIEVPDAWDAPDPRDPE